MTEGTLSYPDHEHEWGPVLRSPLGGQGSLRGPVARGLRCTRCGLEIVEIEGTGIRDIEYRGPVSAYLHTCSACGKTYHDGHPFSEIHVAREGATAKFCSLTCYAETQERWRKEDLAKLVPTLESMVANDMNDVARVLADERLRVIATDEEEPLRSQARDALKRARQKRKENVAARPAAAK